MKQSLTDIMRCVSVVTEHNQLHGSIDPRNEEGSRVYSSTLDDFNPEDKSLYCTARSSIDEKDEWDSYDCKEAEQVMKYIRMGGGEKQVKREEDSHWYFSLRTGIDDNEG